MFLNFTNVNFCRLMTRARIHMYIKKTKICKYICNNKSLYMWLKTENMEYKKITKKYKTLLYK